MAERPGAWRRSSRCEAVECVEVRLGSHRVGVRDSVSGHAIEVPPPAWRAFCAGIKAGDFRTLAD
ncbi:DUF397 domain-containing protein [Micromonospora sp. CPCC 205371]|nr:DUF397 domain-containing protein [Micromonospora sp. CPCC 205371]